MLRILPPFLQAMASTEDKAYEIMRELDVDYVLVIFGGLTGYSSDGECTLILISKIFFQIQCHILCLIILIPALCSGSPIGGEIYSERTLF